MGDEWEASLEENELVEGVPVTAKVGKRTVLFLRTGEKIYAVSGKCPHYGAPLHKGVIRGGTITCPWHHARFDIETGRLIAPPALKDLVYFDVKLEGGRVWVRKADTAKPSTAAGTEEKTFVIVGAGASGNSCAVTLRQEGFGGRIVMITREEDLPYDRPNLSKDFLSGEAGPEWIPLERQEYYDELGIEIMKRSTVTGIDIEGRIVQIEGNRPLLYDSLLLCTGSIPRLPDIPGTDLNGFHLLRSFADAREIERDLAERDASSYSAVVLGASFIGLEVAQALLHRGIEVHVVAPESIPMERVFGSRVGELLKTVHEQHGVRFHLGETAQAIEGKKRVSGVTLSSRDTIPADLVVAGIGVMPAVDFLEGTPLLQGGGIPVDTHLESGVKGIFAAGDIALVPDPLTGEKRRVEHWVEAERQGQHAARSMMGIRSDYREIPFFWTKQYDTSLKYVGYTKQFDKIVYRGEFQSSDFIAGYYYRGILRAVAGIGREKEIILLEGLLRERRDIPESMLRDENSDLEGSS
jgi:NADPH-dependent 2,4-dienoyl-CoA reductase/sulfur reductase-like enzyme/nitrite reductase/ring-hydroxylating ferredoxin subunit